MIYILAPSPVAVTGADVRGLVLFCSQALSCRLSPRLERDPHHPAGYTQSKSSGDSPQRGLWRTISTPTNRP